MNEALQGEIQDRFCYVELCISRQRVVDGVPMHVQYFLARLFHERGRRR